MVTTTHFKAITPRFAIAAASVHMRLLKPIWERKSLKGRETGHSNTITSLQFSNFPAHKLIRRADRISFQIDFRRQPWPSHTILGSRQRVCSEYQPSQDTKTGRVSEAPWAILIAANVDTGITSIHPFPSVSETPTKWLAWNYHTFTRKDLITSLKGDWMWPWGQVQIGFRLRGQTWFQGVP